jgi:hypothetical protein
MYSQSNFFYGGINTDDEDRLIPNTDFRDAFYSRNYGINTSDEGALQSMTGNLLRTNSNLPIGINIVIGACEDTEGKDATTSGNLILFVWNDLDHHTIWRYSTQDFTYTKILESFILNFQLDYPVYQAAVINNLLYWTDNYFNSYEGNDFNPPRKINIEKAILYTESGGTDPNGYSEITFDNLDWIKHPPLFSPTFFYITDENESANNLLDRLFQFRYQYIYDDNEESAWSPISEMTLPNKSEYVTQTVSLNTFTDNTIKLNIETGSSITRLIRVAYRIGNNGEFLLYKEYDKKQLEWSDYSIETIDFKNDTAGPAISTSERNYDLIPQIAKSIEYLPSNEFSIGNYIEGYDKQEINDDNISFEILKNNITEINFTYPLVSYYSDFGSGTSPGRVGLYIYFTARGDDFFKYRFQTGDVVILQLKDENVSFGSVVIPDPTIYFTVPYIDPNIYTTDLQKTNQLCVELKNYLATLGIDSDVKPPGFTTGPYPNVDWPCLKIFDKYWYNTSETQQSEISGGTVVVFRENRAKRTFKTGTKHEFAIQYYDRANRDGTVLTIPVGEVYVPFNTDYTNLELNSPTGLNRSPYYTKIRTIIDSNYQPPIWADTYQILYKPSTNIANFQQRSVTKAIYNPDSTITLELEGYYKNNVIGASINQTPSRGDFVRFVRKRALFNNEAEPLGILIGPASAYPIPLAPDQVQNEVPLFNDDLIAAYNPYGYITTFPSFVPPTTQVYNVKVNLKFNITYPDGSGITTMIVSAYVRNLVTGVSQIIAYTQDNFYNSGLNLDINENSNLTLTAGQGYEIILTVLYQVADGGPANIDLVFNAVSTTISYSLASSDSDMFGYYPGYVTKENKLNQELNVLSYNPAFTATTESIVVNNFDISLLGEYLVYETPDNATIATGGFQIEIYTPKKENENEPWYEVGVEFPILQPHTENRSHAGDQDQIVGVSDGVVDLDCGDVYIRQRVMATGYDNNTGGRDANDHIASWFCEDPHYSDFYISNWNNKGRIGLFSAFAKRQHLKSSVYHTNSFIDNTQINGLSRVEFFNNISLKEEHGGINKLVQIGDILKAFQDRKITSIYIQKAFALNGDGTNNVILSDKTFGGVRPHDDDYGSIHTGSISRVENNVFFYDYYNSAFGVVTAGGIINICEQEKKFSKGVRDLTSRVNNIYGGYNNANIWSHINRNNNEYTFYISDKVSENLPTRYELPVARFAAPNLIFLDGNYTSAFTPGTQIFIEGSPNVENNGSFITGSDRYLPGSNETEIQIPLLPNFATEDCVDVVLYWYGTFSESNGEGISYSYERNRWITRLNHGVSFANQLGSRAYSTGGGNIFNFGELFEENFGGELTFLDTPRIQQLQFVFNDNPTVVKRFYTHLQQANYPFAVSVSVPANQTYPLGMNSDIPSAVLKNQEGYYVSRYFRDLSDPAFTSPLEARMNGRELRGYVLKHILTNSDTSVKKILMNVGVNFAASEPIIQ